MPATARKNSGRTTRAEHHTPATGRLEPVVTRQGIDEPGSIGAFPDQFATAHRAAPTDRVDDPEGLGVTLEAYLTSPAMAPFSSRYDDYIRGASTLTPKEALGLSLFKDPKRGGCAVCHKLVDTSPRLNDLDESERPWVSDPLATGLVSIVPELEGEADSALWVGSPVRNAGSSAVDVLCALARCSAETPVATPMATPFRKSRRAMG